MYDVMDFIDSKEIRDFNREYPFTPAEQAALIARSEKATVEEKLKALQYLAERYSKEEFQEGNVYGMDNV